MARVLSGLRSGQLHTPITFGIFVPILHASLQLPRLCPVLSLEACSEHLLSNSIPHSCPLLFPCDRNLFIVEI